MALIDSCSNDDELSARLIGEDGREGPGTIGGVMLDATPRPMLTIPEAALRLSVGRTTMYGMLRSGELASVAVGRLRRIPIDSLEGFLSLLLSLIHI